MVEGFHLFCTDFYKVFGKEWVKAFNLKVMFGKMGKKPFVLSDGFC